ncbi:hypothetical protein EVAR_31324_1 [Eumeta japonica]|uniref:RNA-directed DNA polymerase from mobile element jockey n=1 Tax=Eumeta variegata TaxID=151549 RepID=A0A4C1Y041_EUMVA|nr:hypothetical protein EVAR_31324_1 [Eumeta japonica]
MTVNVNRTAALLTDSQRNILNQLRLRNQDVVWKGCVRYLGVHIHCSLRMVPQMDHVIQISRTERAKLRPILTSRLPIRTKMVIYYCYIRSCLTYSPPAWYALFSKRQCQHLQIKSNRKYLYFVDNRNYT